METENRGSFQRKGGLPNMTSLRSHKAVRLFLLFANRRFVK